MHNYVILHLDYRFSYCKLCYLSICDQFAQYRTDMGFLHNVKGVEKICGRHNITECREDRT